MDELVSRITASVGVDEDIARQAVGIILSFLQKEGDGEKVAVLLERIPGAKELVADTPDTGDAAGGLGGLMGGGAMAVLNALQGIGLGMGQIQGVTQETVAFARERAGDDVVDDIVASIPGLSQFV